MSQKHTQIFYYMTPNGENPVSDFLDDLNEKQQSKLLRIIKTIEGYGLISILPHVKKLNGTPLWEIRILGKDNIRVLYATIQRNSVVFLHGFIKKTQKTAKKEIATALTRLEKWKIST